MQRVGKSHKYKIRSQIRATYEADFDAVVIGEVETSPIRSTSDIIWSINHRTFDGPQVSESVPANCGLEYFYDGISANQLPGAFNRLPMVDRIYEKSFWV
jgi:hypothetical protein